MEQQEKACKCDKIKEENKRLKEENERLKKEIEALKKFIGG